MEDINMSDLTNLLRLANSSGYDRQKMLGSGWFNQYLAKKSYPSEKRRELLKGDANEVTTLVITEVEETILGAAKDRAVFRNILPIVESETYKGRIPYAKNPSNFAPIIPEASAIEVATTPVDSTTVTIEKAATQPLITNEMIEDEKYSTIELELKRAGVRLENTLNQRCLDTLLDDHGTSPSDIDPAGAKISWSDVLGGIKTVSNLNWNPNTFVVHPEAQYWLYSGSKEVFSLSFDGKTPILGMNCYTLEINTSDRATSYWDATDASNHYYGMIFDSLNYAAILMRHDIKTEKYNDPIYDLKRLTATMRFGVAVTNDDACVLILSK